MSKLSEKKELYEAFYKKRDETMSYSKEFIISAKGESVAEAMTLFKEIKEEMKDE